MSCLDVYAVLEKRQTSTSQLIHTYIHKMLDDVSRKIIFKEKYHDPWIASCFIFMPFTVFLEFFKVIRDYVPNFGKSTKKILDAKANTKEIIISFTHMGTFLYHMRRLSGDENIVDLLEKRNAKTLSKASVNITEEKPAVFTYNVKKNIVTFSIPYNVKNKYGMLISL